MESQLHGMFAAKLAVTLMLVGGVTRTSPDGMHIRGDIHVLMVGDPGTGVSSRLTRSSHCGSGSGQCHRRAIAASMRHFSRAKTEQVGRCAASGQQQRTC